MTPGSGGRSLLGRAGAVHRLHCEAIEREGGGSAEPELAVPQAGDAVFAYGLAARRIYDGLRRLIGQTGGLLILAQASGCREILDLPSLESADDRHREIREGLAILDAPARLEPHRQRLRDATSLAGACLAALRDLRSVDGEPDLGASFENLSAAHRCLQAASDARFGMMMVDFRHACCTCGAAGPSNPG